MVAVVEVSIVVFVVVRYITDFVTGDNYVMLWCFVARIQCS